MADADGVCDSAAFDQPVAIGDVDAATAAATLGLCQNALPGSGFGLVDVRFTRAGGESPGVAPAGFPQHVASCGVRGAIFDDVALEVRLRAPANARGLSFRFKFYSLEYPDFVCSPFNDQFVALMDPPPPGTYQGNITFDTLGGPITVNAGFFQVCQGCHLGTAELSGTGFDTWGDSSPAGGTAWLRTSVPVQGGQEFTLRFMIWDTGDFRLDSTVLLDGFQWLLDSVPLTTAP